MKFKILVIFLLTGIFSYANTNDTEACYTDDAEFFWGQTGHRVVGEIAYLNLTNKARRNIEKLLKGEGLAIISTFADDMKSDRKYDKYRTWHYINFKDGETYENSEKNPKGDLITGIKKCKEVISDPNASDEDKVFYIKLLVHLIGDLHQPMHIGRAEDRGGNSIKLKWFFDDYPSSLHSVWDSKMIDQFGMSYSELSKNLNNYSKKQVAAIQEGTVLDWVNETRVITTKTYNSVATKKPTPRGTKLKDLEQLSYPYMYHNFQTVKTQLRKGGLRLAKVLNDLFG